MYGKSKKAIVKSQKFLQEAKFVLFIIPDNIIICVRKLCKMSTKTDFRVSR